eukprot:366435-Chlamydomonas_euryale.AAC.9
MKASCDLSRLTLRMTYRPASTLFSFGRLPGTFTPGGFACALCNGCFNVLGTRAAAAAKRRHLPSRRHPQCVALIATCRVRVRVALHTAVGRCSWTGSRPAAKQYAAAVGYAQI